MTDGDEDVGAGDRKRYLLQWHQGDGDTHIYTWGTHYRSLILYSNGLEQWSLPIEHIHTQEDAHTPLTCLLIQWL